MKKSLKEGRKDKDDPPTTEGKGKKSKQKIKNKGNSRIRLATKI